MLNTITSLPQAQISRDLSRVSSQPVAPRSLSAELALPTESFVSVGGNQVAESVSSTAVVPTEVKEAKPSQLQTVTVARAESVPMTLSLLGESSISDASQESVGSTLADLAYAGMAKDSESPLFAFGNSWLSKIPKAEGTARGAVQAAVLEELSNGATEFGIEDVKGVFASAQSKLDRLEDQRVLNDSLFKTLASNDPNGNALEVAQTWKKSVPGGEPTVRNAITDTLLQSFLDQPNADLELSGFKAAYDGVMSRLDRPEDQRTAADSFFRVISRESDSDLTDFGKEWLSRYGKEDGVVKAAITDQIIDQLLTTGGEFKAEQFGELYGKIQGELTREEDLQTLTNGLFAFIGKESDSSLIEVAKSWIKEVPAGEVSARNAIINSFVGAFLANPGDEHDAQTIVSTYRSVVDGVGHEDDRRLLNDAFMTVLKKDSGEEPLFELATSWSKSIPAGEKSARNAITDGILEFFLQNPERGDLDTQDLPDIYQSVLAQVGHEDDLRLLNDSLLRNMSRDTDSKLLEVGKGWLKAIPVDNRVARAAVTDTVLGQFMAEPTTDLEASGLPALAQAAVEQAGHRYIADDVVSGLLEFLAKGSDRKDLVALAKQRYSDEGLQKKLDAISTLVEGQA